MSVGNPGSYSRAAGRRTVGGAFAEFLDRQINISAGTRRSASTSQNHLRELLAAETDADPTFPRVLSIEDEDFLGGSWARQTKVWPLDDIDVYLPLDAFGLVYTQGGVVQPVNALTDGVLDENPLLADRDRWMAGPHISSAKLITEFAEVLRDHYPTTTRVRRVGEAVSVKLANDLGFDVVPCFSLRPRTPYQQHFYLIPDGSGGWIHTNPRIDTEVSERLHAANAKTLRKAVKLVKWWIGEFIGGRIESYFAELAVMRAFDALNRAGRQVTTVPAAVEIAFRAVRDAAASGTKEPLLAGAPPVEPGEVTENDLQMLGTDVEWSGVANQYESLGRAGDALAAWGRVFGDSFPTE